jgi:hypothetical protein
MDESTGPLHPIAAAAKRIANRFAPKHTIVLGAERVYVRDPNGTLRRASPKGMSKADALRFARDLRDGRR